VYRYPSPQGWHDCGVNRRRLHSAKAKGTSPRPPAQHTHLATSVYLPGVSTPLPKYARAAPVGQQQGYSGIGRTHTLPRLSYYLYEVVPFELVGVSGGALSTRFRLLDDLSNPRPRFQPHSPSMPRVHSRSTHQKITKLSSLCYIGSLSPEWAGFTGHWKRCASPAELTARATHLQPVSTTAAPLPVHQTETPAGASPVVLNSTAPVISCFTRRTFSSLRVYI
jgi:hypothetical protein